ncbi:MAG: thermonuclease family protein [Planctomycetota bacterium]|jgi:endonuclease YncB( thermonuclease family)
MNNVPQTPNGYGQPPFPAPPHAGYGPPPKSSNKWIIIVVILVVGIPALLVVLGAVGFFMLASSSPDHMDVPEPSVSVAPTFEEHTIESRAPWLCTEVTDGDSIVVSRGETTEHVRLLCIDTPEKDQTGYDEATEALAAMVEGKMVKLIRDPKHDERDKYGRLLAYVMVKDGNDSTDQSGLNANVEMVRLGHTKYNTFWGASSIYADEFKAAQK